MNDHLASSLRPLIVPQALGQAEKNYSLGSLLVVDLDVPDDSGLELLRGRAEADRRNVSVLLLIDGGFDFRPLMRRDPLLAVGYCSTRDEAIRSALKATAGRGR